MARQRKIKTSTGALPHSVGFPGSNKVHNKLNPDLLWEKEIGGPRNRVEHMWRYGDTLVLAVSECVHVGSETVLAVAHDFNDDDVNKKLQK